MSRNMVIQEGGIAKQLTADKLKTNLVGGGTCLWVPEDEVQLTIKTITENGTYNASDDGYYGYSQVIVSGIGSATGMDGDGDEATATVDPETGEIVITKIPSKIVIETPPSKLEYSEGDAINLSGVVVKAYLKTGGVWSDSSHQNGIIPINELILPVSVVGSGMEREYDSYGSDLDTSPLPNPIGAVHGSFITQGEYEWGERYSITGEKIAYNIYHGSKAFNPAGDVDVACIGNRINGSEEVFPIFASSKAGRIGYLEERWYNEYHSKDPITGEWVTSTDDEQVRTTFVSASNDTKYTHDNKSVYYLNSSLIVGDQNFPSPVPVYSYTTINSIQQVAWTMLYGNYTEGGYKVPVQWKRSGDGAILETSFTIKVT